VVGRFSTRLIWRSAQGDPSMVYGHGGLRVRARCGHNRAAVAIANKLARIVWATWYRERDFESRTESQPA